MRASRKFRVSGFFVREINFHVHVHEAQLAHQIHADALVERGETVKRLRRVHRPEFRRRLRRCAEELSVLWRHFSNLPKNTENENFPTEFTKKEQASQSQSQTRARIGYASLRARERGHGTD